MDELDEHIAKFWRTFQRRESALVAGGGADSAVYEMILSDLQAIDSGLYFEYCGNSSPKELIITADGKSELFATVFNVVDDAPEISGWKIFALKPRLGFPEFARWEGFELAIDSVRFQSRTHRETGKLAIELLVTGVPDSRLDSAHNALLRAIDHGLGEQFFAEQISATWITNLAPEQHASTGFPLNTLFSYLSNRV